MVVLDEFYEISERETGNVNSLWKVTHIALFIITAITGFLTTFEFGQIMNDFNNNCIIGADITFLIPKVDPPFKEPTEIYTTPPSILPPDENATIIANNSSTLPTEDPSQNNTNISNNTITTPSSIEINATGSTTQLPKGIPWPIDLTQSVWGTPEGCQFVQFTPITSMISAIVWGAFFVIIARGGKGYPNDFIRTPWQVIYPCMAFSLVFAIILAISTCTMSNGIEDFCKEFHKEFGTTECSSLIDLHTAQFHDNKEMHFYRHYKIVIISAYISLISWLTQLGLLIGRVFCVVDFKIHHVRVSEKEEEYVQQVIEYHDDPLDEHVSQV